MLHKVWAASLTSRRSWRNLLNLRWKLHIQSSATWVIIPLDYRTKTTLTSQEWQKYPLDWAGSSVTDAVSKGSASSADKEDPETTDWRESSFSIVAKVDVESALGFNSSAIIAFSGRPSAVPRSLVLYPLQDAHLWYMKWYRAWHFFSQSLQ